jgi:hypothetical protein
MQLPQSPLTTSVSDETLASYAALGQAEFKGKVLQSLDDIRLDIAELKTYNRDTRFASLLIAGFSGIVTSALERFAGIRA